MKKALVVLFVLCLATVSMEAQFRQGTVKLFIVHKKGIVEARTLNDVLIDTSSLAAAEVLEVRSAQTVQVWIADPNSLLYKYEWLGLKLEDNIDYQQALAFAKAVQPVIGFLTPGGRESGPIAPSKEVQDFAKDVDRLAVIVDSIPTVVQKTINDSAGAKTDVKTWDLQALDTRLNKFFATQKTTAFRSVRSLVAPLPAASGGAASGGAASGGAASGGTAPGAAAPAAAAGDGLTPLGGGTQPAPGTAFSSDPALVAILIEPEVREMLAAAKKIATAVSTVDEPYKLGEVPYNFKQNSTAQVKIDAVGDALLVKQANRSTGTFNLPVQAYSPVSLRMAPAAVYSFVRAPEFTTKKLADGKLEIIEKTPDYRGLNVSAMMTITPRPWAEPPFGGAFQLGVSPVKNQVGLFGGGLVRFADVISFGFGYAYQQVPKLAEGLTVGSTIDSPDLLKTEPEFKSGFYLSINVTLPGAK